MAKKKTGTMATLEGLKGLGDLPNLVSHPMLYNEPFVPQINPDVFKNVKPIGEQFKEALEPVYAELARVTGELEKANERAEKAEAKTLIAEEATRKANRITLVVSILAIVVPVSQAAYYDYKNGVKDKEVASLASNVKQLYQRIKTLEGDVSKDKKQPLPAKAPKRNNVGSKSL